MLVPHAQNRTKDIDKDALLMENHSLIYLDLLLMQIMFA